MISRGLFILGVTLFLVGYLSIELVSERCLIPSTVETKKQTQFLGVSAMDYRPPKRRLVVFLLDGARPEYLFNETVRKDDWEPFFSSLLSSHPNHTVCSTMQVDPPTSTTQGVKTLLTGGIPNFIELGQTFFSSKLEVDHWLYQLTHYGNRSVEHVGDPVWRELAGPVFRNEQSDVDAYNVYTDDSEEIQEAIDAYVTSPSPPDVLILHSLLVDHNAHKSSTSSPSSPPIHSSLLQFNRHISSLVSRLPNDTLLLVFGDHGLNAHGTHGGATHDERTTGLCAFSSSYPLGPFTVPPPLFCSLASAAAPRSRCHDFPLFPHSHSLHECRLFSRQFATSRFIG